MSLEDLERSELDLRTQLVGAEEVLRVVLALSLLKLCKLSVRLEHILLGSCMVQEVS